MPLQKNNLPQLDARLSAAAAFVRSGITVADIGCDHGKLSLHLAAQNLCNRVIACDISPRPLAVAARNFALHGFAQTVECRLGDGLSVLRTDEVDDIIIAGVSGVTITEILSAAPDFWAPRYRFIFVPSSKNEALRAWLCENGFALLHETAAKAAGRYYAVMHVQYTGEKYTPRPIFCAAGLIAHEKTAAAHGYLQKVACQLAKQGDAVLAKEVEDLCRP